MSSSMTMSREAVLLATCKILVLAVSLTGCDSGRRTGEAEIRVDRDHCTPPAVSRTEDQLRRFAVLCAEAFVRRNGFTSYPPVSDSTQWTLNWMESGRTPSEAVAKRRNRLQDNASGVCKRLELGSAYVVAFRNRSEDTTFGRLVAVDSSSFALKMAHQPAFVTPFLARAGCLPRERIVSVR
jgi:hypothetical protein